MKKFIALSLAELLVALSALAVLAIAMVTNLKTGSFDAKANVSKAYNVFQGIQKASLDILEMESTRCPAKTFITKVLGQQEYAILNKTGSAAANSSDVAAMYGAYMDNEVSESEIINFCSYTSYCSSSAIKGLKLPNDVYIGFEVFGNTALQACPTSYYMPDPKINTEKDTNKELITNAALANVKCWGKLYVDVDGKKGEGVLGKDVYVWGLGESGIVY